MFSQNDLTIEQTEKIIDPDEKRAMLKIYSTSDYNDLTWRMDKRYLQKNSEKKALSFTFFSSLPELLDEVKTYSLELLIRGMSTGSILQEIANIRILIREIAPELQSISELKSSHLLSYYKYLFESEDYNYGIASRLQHWHGLKSFLYSANPQMALKAEKFIVPALPEKNIQEIRLIPEEVLNALDSVFKREELPLTQRIIYWTLRLFPNRVNEVTSMSVDCLKKISDTSYVLTIPTFKAAGGYALGQPRKIEIIYEGIGKYYIDLIKEHLKARKEYNIDSSFLLMDTVWTYQAETDKYFRKSNTLFLTNGTLFNNFLKKIIKRENIYYKDKPAHVTSHMFRHNAITDRINKAGFRPIDIKALTGHQNTAMIEQCYLHPDMKATQKTIDELEDNSTVRFEGRVLDQKDYNKIIQRAFSMKISDLGVCADIRLCQNNPLSCLNCPKFIIEKKQKKYLEYLLSDWKNKLDLAKRSQNSQFQETCLLNISLIELVLTNLESEEENV